MINEILFMEIRLLGGFCKKYKMGRSAANDLFSKYKIWQYIESCYDMLHVNGDEYNLDEMNACADMILTDAIEDLAVEDNISIEESRNRLLRSNACKCLYDFDSGLWREGSDYFLDYYRRFEN